MSSAEHDATDLMLERTEREEPEKLDGERGQHILDMAAAHRSATDPLVETLQRAHQAKRQAEADRR
jgi:hypothetical protein